MVSPYCQSPYSENDMGGNAKKQEVGDKLYCYSWAK